MIYLLQSVIVSSSETVFPSAKLLGKIEISRHALLQEKNHDKQQTNYQTYMQYYSSATSSLCFDKIYE